MSSSVSAGRARAALTISAVVLAAAGVIALAALLLIAIAGGHPWTGLVWIPMFALPLAFVLMILSVVAAVRRRRVLGGPGREGPA